jgi:hypothetical protein
MRHGQPGMGVRSGESVSRSGTTARVTLVTATPFLQTICRYFHERATWPKYDYLDLTLSDDPSDFKRVWEWSR